MTVTDTAWAKANPGTQLNVTVTATDSHSAPVATTVAVGTVNNAAALGLGASGQTTIPALPAGVTYTKVAAGYYHTVLLRSDGQAVAVGGNNRGQTSIPALAAGVTYTDIAAGLEHTVLLRSDGQAVAVGNNDSGQTSIPTPEGGVTYTQVAAGGNHTVLLRSDGQAVAVGDNGSGQNNIPTPEGGMTYTQVAAGGNHTVLLRSDGQAVAVGLNNYGQSTIPPPGGATYTQVAAGASHTVLLRSDGTVVARGYNAYGQTNIPPLQGGAIYTRVAAGWLNTVLVRSDGQAVAVGLNNYGQSTIPALPAGAIYTQAAAGQDHTVLLSAFITPVATGAQLSTAEDTALIGNVLDYVTDFDTPHAALTAALGTGPQHAQSFSLSPDGSFAYTPAANYTGADAFTYTAFDGALTSNAATVAITVTPVNDAPVAAGAHLFADVDDQLIGNVLDYVTDVDTPHAALTAALGSGPPHAQSFSLNPDGSFAYTPAANYTGPDSFTYTASDGSLTSNEATVAITVAHAPVAAGAQLSTDEDTQLSGNVLDYVTDIDTPHAALTAALGSGPAHAQSFSLHPDGSFTYTPKANWSGDDSFTYTASDGSLTSNTATVAITVKAVNDAPVATGAQLSTDVDDQLSGNVLDYVTDVDTPHAALTAALGSGPAHAQSFSLNPDGSFTYTPAANYAGVDSFTYTASDGELTSNSATVAITVAQINDAPVAAGALLSTAEDTALSGNVLDYVTDVDTPHAALTAVLGSGPNHAQSFSLHPDGSFSYTPAANYTGPDSFTYTASDGALTSNEATVAITVTPVGDAPVATGAQLRAYVGTQLSGNVLDYVTDVDTPHAALTAVLGSGPAHAQSFSLHPDGSFAYTPAANYTGPDSFTYTASDGALTSNEATVAITVAVNHAPVINTVTPHTADG